MWMEHAVQNEQTGVVAELPLRKGPGERLRAARVAAGMPIGRVASELHLHEDLLEALERDVYAQMPGRVFARGYLRNYARLVELDPDQILAAYDALFPAPEEATEEGLHRVVMGRQLRTDVDSGHGVVRIVTWAIVIGLIGLLLIWWQGYLSLPGLSQSESASPAEPPVAAVPDAPSPAMQRDVVAQLGDAPPRVEASVSPATVAEHVKPVPPTPVTEAAPAPPAASAAIPAVTLQVTARTWAEVVDATGRFKLSGTYDKGFSKVLGGEPPYRITIGNVNGARVTVDGEPVDLAPHFNGRLVRLTLDPRQPTKAPKPQ
jgi:cytoskeleton protein RodZ